MKKERKKYMKPEVRKNEPLVNITFASGTTVPGTTIPGTGGAPGTAIN